MGTQRCSFFVFKRSRIIQGQNINSLVDLPSRRIIYMSGWHGSGWLWRRDVELRKGD